MPAGVSRLVEGPLFKWTYGVVGGSPGFGGCIIVIARRKDHAERLAYDELSRLNDLRTLRGDGWSAVQLEMPVTKEPITIPGVVYSYDGEA